MDARTWRLTNDQHTGLGPGLDDRSGPMWERTGARPACPYLRQQGIECHGLAVAEFGGQPCIRPAQGPPTRALRAR
jgi:hypothetical protein